MPKRPEVDRWFAAYDNPMKEVVMAVREAVLAADARVDECIKWQAPTFTYKGNIASFFPKAKQHASLMFHEGARIPGAHPRLEGQGATARMMKFASLADLRAGKRDLQIVVKAWITWRDGGGASGALKAAGTRKPPPAKKKATKKKATKKKATKKK